MLEYTHIKITVPEPSLLHECIVCRKTSAHIQRNWPLCQNSSWELSSCSADKEIPGLLWNLVVHYEGASLSPTPCRCM